MLTALETSRGSAMAWQWEIPSRVGLEPNIRSQSTPDSILKMILLCRSKKARKKRCNCKKAWLNIWRRLMLFIKNYIDIVDDNLFIQMNEEDAE